MNAKPSEEKHIIKKYRFNIRIADAYNEMKLQTRKAIKVNNLKFCFSI